ncbi:hypothetical protein RKH83_28155 [Klebsiella pneumoniae]|nr:hypothetical protein [Klebsiella pneumoniae]
MVALSHQAKKCPDEPGETGMMENAVHGWVSRVYSMKSSQWRPAVKRAVTATAKLAL